MQTSRAKSFTLRVLRGHFEGFILAVKLLKSKEMFNYLVVEPREYYNT